MSPDQLSRSELLAGRPVSSLAAHNAVAALPLPPPSPAPVEHAPKATTEQHVQKASCKL